MQPCRMYDGKDDFLLPLFGFLCVIGFPMLHFVLPPD